MRTAETVCSIFPSKSLLTWKSLTSWRTQSSEMKRGKWLEARFPLPN